MSDEPKALTAAAVRLLKWLDGEHVSGIPSADVREVLATLDAALARVERAENEAAALREAVDEIVNCLGPDRAGCSETGCEGCEIEMNLALKLAKKALASGAGERVAEVLAKVRHLREWVRGSAERADQPRGAFDDSAEIEWDARVDAVCAALDALDGGMR